MKHLYSYTYLGYVWSLNIGWWVHKYWNTAKIQFTSQRGVKKIEWNT